MPNITFDELVNKFQELRKLCYQNFALRITNIENYLSTLTEKVQNGKMIVTGNLEVAQITPLNISEAELLEVYNNVPKVLFKNSIAAELAAKSFWEESQNQPIFLEKDDNGKYWVIVSNQTNIWLVPNINIKLHIHKLKTVEKLFRFTGNTPTPDSNFILLKPAILSSLPNGKEWRLEEQGLLEFSNGGYDPQLTNVQNNTNSDLELQKISQQVEDLTLQLQQSNYLRQKLELQMVEMATQLKSLSLQLSDNQEYQKNLQSQLGKMTVLRDFVYLQIDLLKTRIEFMEQKDK